MSYPFENDDRMPEGNGGNDDFSTFLFHSTGNFGLDGENEGPGIPFEHLSELANSLKGIQPASPASGTMNAFLTATGSPFSAEDFVGGATKPQSVKPAEMEELFAAAEAINSGIPYEAQLAHIQNRTSFEAFGGLN